MYLYYKNCVEQKEKSHAYMSRICSSYIELNKYFLSWSFMLILDDEKDVQMYMMMMMMMSKDVYTD